MKPIFKDKGLQERLETDGYVKVKALGPAQVDALLQLYQDLKKEAGAAPFHVSLDRKDKAEVSGLVDRIQAIAQPELEPFFQEAKAFTASFVVKEPHPKAVVPVHQDWTFVGGEGEFCSLTCWIPLVPVTMENGALGVIKGSHRFLEHIRPSPSPHVPTPIGEHMFTIFPFLEIIEMEAGDALIFDNRTFHASPPNTTEAPRIAVGIGFTQQEAPLRHYYLKPGPEKNTLLEYAVDEEFFKKYDNGRLKEMYERGEVIREYECLNEWNYEFPVFEQNALISLIESAGNAYNSRLVAKMAALFQEELSGRAAPARVAEPVLESEVANDRPTLWKVYTPGNIIREVLYRMGMIKGKG